MPIFGVGLVLAVLAAITLWKQRGTNPNESGDSDDSAAVAAAESYSTASAARLRERDASASPALNAEQAVKGILAEREQGRAEQTARSARYKGAIVAKYRGETTDPAWANGAERTLQALATDPAVQAAGLVPGDMSIDCKRTTCRTTANFSNNGQADDWSMLYMASGGAILRNSVVSRTQNADGSIALDIYSAAK